MGESVNCGREYHQVNCILLACLDIVYCLELRSACRKRTAVVSYDEVNLIRVFNEALYMSGAQLRNSLFNDESVTSLWL